MALKVICAAWTITLSHLRFHVVTLQTGNIQRNTTKYTGKQDWANYTRWSALGRCQQTRQLETGCLEQPTSDVSEINRTYGAHRTSMATVAVYPLPLSVQCKDTTLRRQSSYTDSALLFLFQQQTFLSLICSFYETDIHLEYVTIKFDFRVADVKE